MTNQFKVNMFLEAKKKPKDDKPAFQGVIIPVEEEIKEKEAPKKIIKKPTISMEQLQSNEFSEVEDKKPLLAWIHGVSPLGVVKIRFNQPLNEELLDFKLLGEDVLSVKIVPSLTETTFNESAYDFDWEVTEYIDLFNELRMKLNFTDALAIS